MKELLHNIAKLCFVIHVLRLHICLEKHTPGADSQVNKTHQALKNHTKRTI